MLAATVTFPQADTAVGTSLVWDQPLGYEDVMVQRGLGLNQGHITFSAN